MAACVAMALAGQAFAQDSTSNALGNANSVANNQAGASAQNAGVNASIYQISDGRMSGGYDITSKAQVPISTVGYGSFSQNSCITSIGGGATTRLFSFVYNGPKADINCQHVVAGDAFGRAAQLAMQIKQPQKALASLSMVFFAYCTGDEDMKTACITMGLIRDTGKTRKVDGNQVAIVVPMPAEDLPPAAVATMLPNLPADQQALVADDSAHKSSPVNLPPIPENANAEAWRTAHWASANTH
jgi:hypothetical protein